MKLAHKISNAIDVHIYGMPDHLERRVDFYKLMLNYDSLSDIAKEYWKIKFYISLRGYPGINYKKACKKIKSIW